MSKLPQLLPRAAFAALAILITFNLSAQTTYPIPQPGAKWGTFFFDYSVMTGYDQSFYYSGDTTMCGEVYGKLERTSSNYVLGFVREDAGKVIFAQTDCSINTDTLYDFSLNLGDTFFRDGYLIGVVDSISSMLMLNGQTRKYMRLVANFSIQAHWVEGIGDLYRDWTRSGMTCIDCAVPNVCNYDTSGLVNYSAPPFSTLTFECDSVCTGGNPILNCVEFDVTSTAITCTSTGSISLSLTHSSGPVTIDWYFQGNLLASHDSLLVNLFNSGLYIAVLTDTAGCSKQQTINLVFIDNTSVDITSTDASSPGGCDGTVTAINFVNMTFPVSFQWFDCATNMLIPGATTGSMINICPGSYYVEVTNAQGCTATSPCATVAYPPLSPCNLGLSASSYSPTCFFGNDGQVDVYASGGVSPYLYSIDNGITWQTYGTFGWLIDSTYFVMVLDSTNCLDTITSIVHAPPLPQIVQATFTGTNCFGSCDGGIVVNVINGNPGYTYEWTNSAGTALSTSNGIANLCPDTYTFVAMDGNACTDTAVYVITGATAITSVLSGTANTCFGACDGTASAQVSGGAGNYNYVWTDSIGTTVGTTATITGLCAGTYQLQVTDTIGCAGTATYTITEPPALAVTLTSSNVTCPGSCDGVVIIQITGGTAPYLTQLVSSGGTITDTVGIITGLCADTYIIDVIDANGCVNSQTYVVTEPAALAVTLTSSNVTCPGSCDGVVIIQITGGTAPYLTQLVSSGGTITDTVGTITGLCADTYSIHVVDANGCANSQSYMVLEPAVLSAVETITPSTCGLCNGEISVQVTGGTGGYSYLWATSGGTVLGTSTSITGLCPGSYMLSIADAHGCGTAATYVVTATSVLSSTVVTLDNTCFGACDGTAFISVSGGTVPYIYDWSNNAADSLSPLASGLCAGTYTVAVSDASGCALNSPSIVISEPTELVASISQSQFPSDVGNCDGSATVLVTGGTPPYTIQWMDCDSSYSGGMGWTPNNLCFGEWLVEVIDANGCVAESNCIDLTAYLSSVQNLNESVEVALYPNPNQGQFSVVVTKSGRYKIQFFNLTGSLLDVREVNLNAGKALEFDALQLSSGTYLLEFRGDNGPVIHKQVLVVE